MMEPLNPEAAQALAGDIADDLIAAGATAASRDGLAALVLTGLEASLPEAGIPADAAELGAGARQFQAAGRAGPAEPAPSLGAAIRRALVARGVAPERLAGVEAVVAAAIAGSVAEAPGETALPAPSEPAVIAAPPSPIPDQPAGPAGANITPSSISSGSGLRERLTEFNDWIARAATPGRARWVIVRLIGVLAAMGLAFLAQGVFEGRSLGAFLTAQFKATPIDWAEQSRQLWGSGLYVAAGLMAALSAPGLLAAAIPKRVTARPAALPAPDGGKHSRSGAWRTALFVLSVAISVAAITFYTLRGESEAIRYLWVISIVLLVIALGPWPFASRETEPRAEHSPPFGALSLVILGVIVVAGFWLRFDRIDSIPSDFHGDMASMGLGAREILLGRQTEIFSAGWAGIQWMAFAHESIFMRVFGNNLYGADMAPVVSGTLIILGWYLLVWRVSDSHRLAALAAAVLAINIPNIHFSRILTYIHPWLYGVWTMFFFVDGLRARRNLSFVLAGIGLAFCVQMYFSGRAIAFIIVALLAWAALFRRAWVTDNVGRLALFGLSVLVGLGPSAVFILRNIGIFMSRTSEVFILNPAVMTHMKGMLGQTTVEGVMLQQVKRSLLMFNYYGDTSTQFGLPEPMFTQAISPFVVLGFFIALLRPRRPGHALGLIWWAIILMTGAILTGEPPFWPRLQGMPPIGALFAAIAMDRILQALSDALNIGVQPGAVSVADGGALAGLRPRIAMAALVALPAVYISANGVDNWNHYFDTVKNNPRPQALIGRVLSKLPPQVAACIFTDPLALTIRETEFLAYPRLLIELPPNAPANALERCPGPPFVWIITPNHLGRLETIRARWPNGVAQQQKSSGATIFTTYLVADGIDLSALSPEQARTEIEAKLPPDPRYTNITAFTADGKPFEPQKTFVGAPSSTAYEIYAGKHTVSGGRFTVQVAPIPGYNAVYDYARLFSANGREYRAEVEDPNATMGDQYGPNEGADGHWWLQRFDPFSGKIAAVAQRNERVPALTTSLAVPDGEYDLYIGSFTGDRNNGAFGLGIRVIP